jgi:hypothetical protein
MSNQEQSPDGKPRKSTDRPSPDVDRHAADGQSDARGKGASDEQGGCASGPAQAGGDGPGKIGLTSDKQPDLVSPSGINQRGKGAAAEKPTQGGIVNLDDDDELRPRGNTTRTGGTWTAEGADSGRLDKAPGAGLSGSNGPSDPEPSRNRPEGRE